MSSGLSSISSMCRISSDGQRAAGRFVSDGEAKMIPQRPDPHLDLVDFALEAQGHVGPPVGMRLFNDPLQKDGVVLPDLEDGAKPPIDLVPAGLEQLPHREQVAVPTMERHL